MGNVCLYCVAMFGTSSAATTGGGLFGGGQNRQTSFATSSGFGGNNSGGLFGAVGGAGGGSKLWLNVCGRVGGQQASIWDRQMDGQTQTHRQTD